MASYEEYRAKGIKGTVSKDFVFNFFSPNIFFRAHWRCHRAISNLIDFSLTYWNQKSTPWCPEHLNVANRTPKSSF